MTNPNSNPAQEHDAAKPAAVTRRTAIKLVLVGIAGAAIGASALPLIRSMGTPAPRRYRFFTDDEAGLLKEIYGQIIPGDDAPGAVDTGAIDFIDRQLGRRYRRYQQAYLGGLDSFRRTCTQVYGRAFPELTPAQKIEALQALEADKVPPGLWDEPSAPAFFNLVLAHTMQSFYGSPRHGGNHAFASYRMLGVDYPPIAGQNRYPKA